MKLKLLLPNTNINSNKSIEKLSEQSTNSGWVEASDGKISWWVEYDGTRLEFPRGIDLIMFIKSLPFSELSEWADNMQYHNMQNSLRQLTKAQSNL